MIKMCFTQGCIAGINTSDASICNTKSAAAHTLIKFGVVRNGVAASKLA